MSFPISDVGLKLGVFLQFEMYISGGIGMASNLPKDV
jgi:hypothetical protein